jgi:hypothetical protein
MGQNMKVWGANTLSALNDVFEMIGSAMAGQGLKTIKDMNDEMERMNAEARLAQRGITRPSDVERRTVMQPTPVGAVPTVRDMPGPKALEFEKQLLAEVEAMRKEAHDAEMKRKADEKSAALKNADAQEAAEQKVTREKAEQLRLEEERAQVKMAELAEKEAILFKAEQENLAAHLETERKILEARANGNEELVKQIRNQERFNKLQADFMKAGEASGPAATKASEMIANEMKALELEAQKRTRAVTAPSGGGGGGGGVGGGGGAGGTTPAPSFGQGMVEGMRGQISQTELLKKIDPGMFNSSAKSLFDEFGKAVGAGQTGAAKNILGKIEGRIERQERQGRIGERLGEDGKMPDPQKLRQEAQEIQELLRDGSKKFGEWSEIASMGSTELEKFVDQGLKDLDRKREREREEGMRGGAESMEAPEVPKVEAPGAAAAEAAKKETPEQSLMNKIETAVEAIKVAVEKIEPKLPMQALA